MNRRWTSRKFLTTLAAQIAAVAVLIWPGHREAIAQAAETIAALAVLALTATGYAAAESSIDRANRASPDDRG
ncbi:MAG: hypothetical protein GC159_14355 [Phycisphaera sp.]|nr:hypothetical protein [Phycisphaera sp.]